MPKQVKAEGDGVILSKPRKSIINTGNVDVSKCYKSTENDCKMYGQTADQFVCKLNQLRFETPWKHGKIDISLFEIETQETWKPIIRSQVKYKIKMEQEIAKRKFQRKIPSASGIF